jgi:recombination protein RecA
MYNEGISVSGDALDTGTIYKVIEKKGNSYTFKDVKLGVGRETAKKFLRENPKLIKDIMKETWEVVERGEAPEEEMATETGSSSNDEEAPLPNE